MLSSSFSSFINVASYNKSFTLHILNTVPNWSHNSQALMACKKPDTGPMSSQENFNVSPYNKLFTFTSKLFKHSQTVFKVSKTDFKVDHVLLIVPPTNTRFNSRVLKFDINSETLVGFISKSQNTEHVYNQLCAFTTVNSRLTTMAGVDKKTSFISVIKAYLGFGKVSLEFMQKLLLPFVGGYSLALGSVIMQNSSWKPYLYIGLCILIGWLVYICTSIMSNLSPNMAYSTTKFADVKGAEEAKQELKNIVEFLKTPAKFTALGGKLPKGVLLVGLPGTGKTLLAKAVAGEAGVPFFCTCGSEFDEVYVGVGAKRVRDLFSIAKLNTPCVIFIDEIDSIGKQRTSSEITHRHANDTINQLLSEMDGFNNNEGVIVLGATNRRKDLDKALTRSGRFDVEVTVLVPDVRGRKELLEFYLGKVKHQNVDIEKLARGTTNFTGADIENLVNQAAVKAAGAGAEHVTMEHLEYARDKSLMGPESLSRVTDEDTNRITAYHEGGHALVAHYTPHATPLHKVTIIARGETLGHTAYIPDRDILHVTKSQLLASLDVTLAGRAAEEVVFGPDSVTSGSSSDLEKATLLATKMVRRWGMSEAVGLVTYSSQVLTSPEMANLIDKEIKTLLQESYKRAKSILIKRAEKHKQLSETLLKEETLDAKEVADILKDG